MKQPYRLILRISFLGLLTAVGTIGFIVLFPQQLFAHEFHYKKFTVYANDKIDPNIRSVLDGALALVQQSELFDSDYAYNILLSDHSFYKTVDDKIFGAGQTARTTLHHIMIKVPIDAAHNLAFPIFPKACAVNLTELVAHEMVHCLQAHRYGILQFNPLRHPPLWKLEGYPEYISKQLDAKGYSLVNDIDRYINQSKGGNFWIPARAGGCEVPDYYYKGRLMVAYLMEVEHWSYDQILQDTRSENELYEKMLKWKGSHLDP